MVIVYALMGGDCMKCIRRRSRNARERAWIRSARDVILSFMLCIIGEMKRVVKREKTVTSKIYHCRKLCVAFSMYWSHKIAVYFLFSLYLADMDGRGQAEVLQQKSHRTTNVRRFKIMLICNLPLSFSLKLFQAERHLCMYMSMNHFSFLSSFAFAFHTEQTLFKYLSIPPDAFSINSRVPIQNKRFTLHLISHSTVELDDFRHLTMWHLASTIIRFQTQFILITNLN